MGELRVMRYFVFAVFMSMVSAGCSEEGPPIAPASGVVTYRGEPVKHAKVVFLPQDVPDGKVAVGLTDEQGRFSVTTVGRDSSREGAVVGKHFVAVTESWPPGAEIPVDSMGMQMPPPRGPWPQKYRDSASGALAVDVVADQDNFYELDLSR
jgi:hypothetical protein